MVATRATGSINARSCHQDLCINYSLTMHITLIIIMPQEAIDAYHP